MTYPLKRKTPLERTLELFTRVRPGEGRSVVLFFTYAFMLLVCMYLVKTLREPLLLRAASAEVKSYAYAAIALTLLFVIPLYGIVFRNTEKRQLIRWITSFFIANLLVFYLMGVGGIELGFVYYVWVGIFNVMIITQFWAYAADTFNLKSGQRLFPVIMAGATLGGLAGPPLAGALFEAFGPWEIMLVAMLILAATLPLVSWSRAALPEGSRALPDIEAPTPPHFLGGFAMVSREPYLALLAVLAVLLNWVNSTGEYILTELVIRFADAQLGGAPGGDRGPIIAAFYANFFFIVNALTVFFQVFLVARLFRWIGVRGAVVVLPIIALIGYGLIVFIPVFTIIRLVKILENSTDYSVMNTTRHALYLPLSSAEKYEGKTAIDTFFWRLGDLVQAGVIFIGLRWFGFDVEHFAAVNMVLALIWLGVAIAIGRHYAARARARSRNEPPTLDRAPPPIVALPGEAFSLQLPETTFSDPDPGDVLTFSARMEDGSALPGWLQFDAQTLFFTGRPPAGLTGETAIVLRATDFDGDTAETRLILRHESHPL